MTERRAKQRGMAFILAMVAVLIISALMGGVLMLSTSHYKLSSTNSDYAAALNTAEAGVNYELHFITDNVNNPANLAHQDSAPFSYIFPQPSPNNDGIRRSFQVHVVDDTTGGIWTAPATDNYVICYLRVISTGTIARVTADGTPISTVSRTVVMRVRGGRLSGPEGKYALFGINNLDISGNLTVNGTSGTNSGPNLDAGGSYLLDGDFIYCGTTEGEITKDPNDLTPPVTGDVEFNSAPEVFPTVNQLANTRAQDFYNTTTTEGVEFFKNNNNNGYVYDSAGNKVTFQGTKFDGKTLKGTSGTIILTAGDYYFTSMDLPGGYTIVADTTNGLVNIWLGGTGGGTDRINGHTQLLNTGKVTDFHIYQGSNRTIWLEGTQDFNGCVYAYNGPDNQGGYYGRVLITGDANINGSVIGYNVDKAQGNAIITLPSQGGGIPFTGLPGDFYGIALEWAEQ